MCQLLRLLSGLWRRIASVCFAYEAISLKILANLTDKIKVSRNSQKTKTKQRGDKTNSDFIEKALFLWWTTCWVHLNYLPLKSRAISCALSLLLSFYIYFMTVSLLQVNTRRLLPVTQRGTELRGNLVQGGGTTVPREKVGVHLIRKKSSSPAENCPPVTEYLPLKAKTAGNLSAGLQQRVSLLVQVFTEPGK